jgi:hypothetical protein
METVGALGEKNVAGKMALRTSRNVLQFGLISRPFRPPTNAKRPPVAHSTTRACRSSKPNVTTTAPTNSFASSRSYRKAIRSAPISTSSPLPGQARAGNSRAACASDDAPAKRTCDALRSRVGRHRWVLSIPLPDIENVDQRRASDPIRHSVFGGWRNQSVECGQE